MELKRSLICPRFYAKIHSFPDAVQEKLLKTAYLLETKISDNIDSLGDRFYFFADFLQSTNPLLHSKDYITSLFLGFNKRQTSFTCKIKYCLKKSENNVLITQSTYLISVTVSLPQDFSFFFHEHLLARDCVICRKFFVQRQ